MLETRTLNSLGVKLAGELEDAVRREGGTAADIKAMTEVGVFRKLLPILRKGHFHVWAKGITIPFDEKKLFQQSMMCFIREGSTDIQEIIDSERFLKRGRFVESYSYPYDLVVASGYELGFGDEYFQYSFQKLRDRIKIKGLRLCPLELGPSLRIHYHNQPKGENLIMPVDPIQISSGDCAGFKISMQKDFLGRVDDDSADGIFSVLFEGQPLIPSNRFVFVKR